MKSALVKLQIYKMSRDAIPNGGGLEDGIRFLSSKESILTGARKAKEWVQQAIQAVRSAADPNPFKEATDEEIAAELVRRIEQKGHATREG